MEFQIESNIPTDLVLSDGLFQAVGAVKLKALLDIASSPTMLGITIVKCFMYIITCFLILHVHYSRNNYFPLDSIILLFIHTLYTFVLMFLYKC